MAPEQAAGRLDAIDPRTDVFALGAILYKVLTRRPPFLARDSQAELSLARSGKIVPPQEIAGSRPLPPGLCEIALRALQRDPADRYQTVDALREDLESFLRGGGWFSTRRFEAGQRIVAEGEAGDAAYVVTEGRCEAYQERPSGKQVLRTLGPGDVFGETALLNAQPRTATVAALEDVTVKVITADAFERELGSSSWVAALVKQLSARFLELEGRLRETQSDDSAGC
jgi:serine/threonine-protein kinase